MKKKTSVTKCFKLPNVIIEDVQLTYSAKVVAATLYAHRNALNYCRLGLVKLARFSGCSVDTVRKALVQLTERGYISTYRNYAWCAQRGRLVYRRDAIICRISTSRGFTFVPRAALRTRLRKSSFAVYLYICRVMGNKGRAFPSLRQIADRLMMGTATVCRALGDLCKQSLIHKEHCVKRNGSHASNSYFLLRQAASSKPATKVAPMRCSVRVQAPQTVHVQPACVVMGVRKVSRIHWGSCAFQLSFSSFSINYAPPDCNPFSP